MRTAVVVACGPLYPEPFRRLQAVFETCVALRLGPVRFALIYLVSIIGSALLINFTGANGIHVGASGAIWGLMTATLVYNIRHQMNPLYALRGIIVNLLYSFSANVSWQGHIGGGIAGLAAALFLCGDNGSGSSRRVRSLYPDPDRRNDDPE